MGLFDRTRILSPQSASQPAMDHNFDLPGAQLLEAADAAYARAEQEFDRSPDTRATLEHAYLTAAQALDGEGHPRRAAAWLGVATIRRYQKGRREDALAAFDAALTAAPDSIEIWDAYLDYITYAVSAAALLAIVERMPASIRVQQLPAVVAVGRGTDRWGTMPVEEQRLFTEALPELLEALDDRPSLGALLSTEALNEYRNGSHTQAHELMLRAVATGHSSPACVDRLTIELVKRGNKAQAAMILRDALTRPVPSDSMRLRMIKRMTRCDAARSTVATLGTTDDEQADEHEVRTSSESIAGPEPVCGVRHLRPGENAVIEPRSWRAQIGWHDPSNTIDVDACALLLGADRRVSSDHDIVFYNQLTSPDGSVRHGGEQTLGSADLFEELRIDLAALPANIDTIAVCASVHDDTFAKVDGLHVRLEGDITFVFAVPPLTIERAVVLFEFYRRSELWKVRAVGQGYDDGLAGLARDFGVDVN